MHTNKFGTNPQSEQYVTVSTHKGLYAYQHLTYGLASAPASFKLTMDQILLGMDKVRCCPTDILIRTDPMHISKL